MATRRAKMREGTCRKTRNGQKYCKIRGRVRFVKSGSRRRSVGSVGGTRRRRTGTRGKTCARFKRVRARVGGTVRRCAKFK